MPRTKLSEQDAYEFRHVLQVRPQDVNHGGHSGNDHLISLVGAARAYLFRSLGISELDLGDGHTGIIMADLAINYKAEAFMFDELLIETHIGELAEKGFRMFHRVTRDSMIIALVETGFVAYNYALKDTVPIPPPFLKRLNANELGSKFNEESAEGGGRTPMRLPSRDFESRASASSATSACGRSIVAQALIPSQLPSTTKFTLLSGNIISERPARSRRICADLPRETTNDLRLRIKKSGFLEADFFGVQREASGEHPVLAFAHDHVFWYND